MTFATTILKGYDAAFESLIGQVKAGCTERGALLARLRSWMVQHMWWQERELRSARKAAQMASERAAAAGEELERALRAMPRQHRNAGSTLAERRASAEFNIQLSVLESPAGSPNRGPGEAGVATGGAASGGLTEGMILAFFDELDEPGAAALLGRLLTQLANVPGSNLLNGAFVSCLSQLHTIDLCASLRDTMTSMASDA